MDIRQKMLGRWFALWRRLGMESPDDDLWILYQFYRLLEHYEEPHRAYHGLAHIEHCLDLLYRFRKEAVNFDAVELAIWFHDVIYHTHRRPIDAPSNEALSAAYAGRVIRNAGLHEDLALLVETLIMVTLHLPMGAKSQDEKLLADIDWSMLGSPWPEFVRSGQKIRYEFARYPDDEFYPRRLRALTLFLKRPSQYYLPHFKAQYEKQARENLKRAIMELRHFPESPA